MEKQIDCANLCEISRSFLRESSYLRFCSRSEREKRFFSWADLYMHMEGKIELDSQGVKTLDQKWFNRLFDLHMRISTQLNFG